MVSLLPFLPYYKALATWSQRDILKCKSKNVLPSRKTLQRPYVVHRGRLCSPLYDLRWPYTAHRTLQGKTQFLSTHTASDHYLELGQTPQVKGSVPQDFLSPVSGGSRKSRPPTLLANWLEIRSAHNTLLRIGSFLEWLTECRKAPFTYYCPLIRKETTHDQPNGGGA